MARPAPEALAALLRALDDAVIIGPKTNLAFLRGLLRSPEFAAGTVDTGFIDANLGRLGAQPHPPDKESRPRRRAASLERRDEGRASPLRPLRPLAGRRFLRAHRFAPHGPRRHRRWRPHARASHRRAPMWIRSRRTRAARTPTRSRCTRPNGGVYAFAGGRQAFVELVDRSRRPRRGGGGRRSDPRADERAPRRSRGRRRRDGRSGPAPGGGRGDEDGACARRAARGHRARP